jgi:hypothetical protein
MIDWVVSDELQVFGGAVFEAEVIAEVLRGGSRYHGGRLGRLELGHAYYGFMINDFIPHWRA